MILFCFTKNSGKDMLLHVLTGGLFLHDPKEFTLLLPVFRESVQYFGQRYAFGNCAPCPQSVKVEDRRQYRKDPLKVLFFAESAVGNGEDRHKTI